MSKCSVWTYLSIYPSIYLSIYVHVWGSELMYARAPQSLGPLSRVKKQRRDIARGDGPGNRDSLPGLSLPSAFLNSPGILLPLYMWVYTCVTLHYYRVQRVCVPAIA